MNLLGNRFNLHRQQCEERRRFVAELESLARRLRADSSRLRAEVERAIAAANLAFAGPLLDRHSKLARSVAAIDAQITEAGEALAAAERELNRQRHVRVQRTGGAERSNRKRAPSSPGAWQAAAPIAGPDGGS